MRQRSAVRIAIVSAAFAVLSGCGDTTTGATADGGGTPDGTTDDGTQPADGQGGVADSGQGAGDAPVMFVPGDGAALPGAGRGTCPDGGTTSLSGTVYDPAGKNPLYNAVVYIPSDPQGPLPAITPGTGSCSASCDPALSTVSGTYVAGAVTDASGAFRLSGVPAGKSIPLVFQLGKWRRKVAVDTQDCADTAVPAALTRLPRNQQEGDVPQMAIVTGACDELACFMRDIGLDATEFSGPAGGGRLHVYRGAGPGPDLAGGGAGAAGDCSVAGCPLWSTKAALEKYDLVLMGCECGEHNETKPDMGPMHDWLDEGGRVLATHYQDTWFKNGPADFQGVAGWLASETDGPTPGPFQIDTTFLAGNNLRAWLSGTRALNFDGTITLAAADVSTSVSSASGSTQRWIYDKSSSSLNTKALSFATPVGGLPLPDGGSESSPRYCGRAMFTDVHAGGGGVSSAASVPASCMGGTMSAEEKALEYLFFDLSGPCFVQPPPHPGF